MAWTTLDETISSGQAGHITDHQQIHNYLNDENAARGIQNVDPSYGNNANSGAYGHPVLTIQQAVTNLGSTGGTIYLSGGTHAVNNVVIAAPITIIGAGRVKTVLQVDAGSARGFWLQGSNISLYGSRSTFMNFTMKGSTSASATTRLIDVDTADWVLIDNCDFWDVGYSRTDNPSQSAGPSAIYTSCTQPINGTGVISDWLTIRSCQFYRCFRGTVTTGCGNGYVIGCTWITGVREQIWASGNTWHFNTGWVVGGGNGGLVTPEYYMRIGGSAYHTVVENFHWETVNAYPGQHDLLIQDTAQKTNIANNVFRAHGTTATYCVDISSSGADNIVGPYALTGNGVFRNTGSGTNVLWQPSDFTGTFAMAIARVNSATQGRTCDLVSPSP